MIPPTECFHNDEIAAGESIQSKLYITFVPNHMSANVPASASDDLKSGGVGQCCRVSSHSFCTCGHTLSSHAPPKLPKNKNSMSYIKPPPCKHPRCRCQSYQYSPSRPEECGQPHLLRRRDFDIAKWRQRVQENPHDYACIGCNLKLTDHETMFELEYARSQRNAAVGDAYRPFMDMSDMRNEIIKHRNESNEGKYIEDGS